MSFLRTFWQRPLRPSLLLLQILLGSLIMTLALSASLASRAQKFPSERFDLVAGYETSNISMEFVVFNAIDLPKLLELSPDVERLAVNGSIYKPTIVVNDKRYALRAGAGVSEGYFNLAPPKLVQGTVFTKEEFEKGQDVALLSERAAKTLFGNADPIGQILDLKTASYRLDTSPASLTPYRIVGIFSSPTTNQFNDLPALYLPYGSSGQVNPASTISVQAKSGRGEAAQAQLLSAVRQLYGNEVKQQGGKEGQDFMVKAPDDVEVGKQGIDQDVIVFGLFGVVALVVSSIGIFSATVIETEERTHEIGVRRALGASAAHIGWSLILRALSFAIVGSVLGIAGAALLIPVFRDSAQALFLFGGARLIFSPFAAVLVFGTVVVVSVVLGLIPAFRVGRLKPVQALRESV